VPGRNVEAVEYTSVSGHYVSVRQQLLQLSTEARLGMSTFRSTLTFQWPSLRHTTGDDVSRASNRITNTKKNQKQCSRSLLQQYDLRALIPCIIMLSSLIVITM
jgi:hypothetical protein